MLVLTGGRTKVAGRLVATHHRDLLSFLDKEVRGTQGTSLWGGGSEAFLRCVFGVRSPTRFAEARPLRSEASEGRYDSGLERGLMTGLE